MTTDPAIAALKRDLRRQAAESRARWAALGGVAAAAAGALARQGQAYLATVPGTIVSGFWPMRDEIDIRPLLSVLHAEGRQLALPVVTAKGQPLIFRAWVPGQALVPGVFGTMAPSPDAAPLDPDILLVPLLGFGRDGRRLGYGGGFYDRTLAASRAAKPVRAVGVAFAGQEMDDIPVEPWDEPLDAVLTEAGVVMAGQR
jgi:5-formyltetrahydrofolate cyclo-ligase